MDFASASTEAMLFPCNIHHTPANKRDGLGLSVKLTRQVEPVWDEAG